MPQSCNHVVSHSKLFHKLKSYNILGKLHNWIAAWLTGRSQSVKIQNIFSSFKSVLSGILQGSVLGPLLFLVFIFTSATSFLLRLIQHSLLMISNFFLMKFLFFLNSCLIMCLHHFSKRLSILSFPGPIYGSFPFLYPSALCCLSLILNLPNLVSTLLATLTFLKFVHALI